MTQMRCSSSAATERRAVPLPRDFQPVLGGMWLVLPLDGEPFCALDFAWQLEEARRRSGIADWYGGTAPVDAIVEALRARGVRRPALVGLDRLSVVDWRRLSEVLGGDADVLRVDDEIAALRRRKSPLELRCLRAACRVTDEALDWPSGSSCDRGSANASSPRASATSCADEAVSGRHSHRGLGRRRPDSDPRAHGQADQRGDSVMIDVGGSWDGYQADASRTWAVGEASPLQRKVWDAIERAMQHRSRWCGRGSRLRRGLARGDRRAGGRGYQLGHRIGHGIGLATSFEWPSLDHDATLLEPGMTFCLEPGVYISGAGNMKLENDVAVTADGYELLTTSDGELEVPVASTRRRRSRRNSSTCATCASTSAG